MSVTTYAELKHHIGHKIECVYYDAEHEYEGDPHNVSVECETCGVVLVSIDKDEEEDNE